MSWAALLNKLSRSMETTETHAEYMKMSKEQQDKIKDIGGFEMCIRDRIWLKLQTKSQKVQH